MVVKKILTELFFLVTLVSGTFVAGATNDDTYNRYNARFLANVIELRRNQDKIKKIKLRNNP